MRITINATKIISMMLFVGITVISLVNNYFITIPFFVLIPIMAVWLLLNYVTISRRKTINSNWLIIFVGWIVAITIVSLLTDNLTFLKVYGFGLVNLVFSVFVYCRYKDSEEDCRTIHILFGMILFGVNLIQITKLNNNVNLIYRSDGAYVICYTTVIYEVYLWLRLCMHDYRGRVEKTIDILLICFYAYCLIMSGFLIAVLITVGGIAVTLFTFKIKNKKAQIVSILLVLMLLLICYLNLQGILSILLSMNLDENYALRLREIQTMLYGSGSSGILLGGRIQRYVMSISSFLKYPITGKLWFVDDSMSVYDVIGYHSTILDMLGLYGIWGFIPLYLIFSPYKWEISSQQRFQMLGLTLAIVATMLLNNQIAAIGVVMYVEAKMLCREQRGLEN